MLRKSLVAAAIIFLASFVLISVGSKRDHQAFQVGQAEAGLGQAADLRGMNQSAYPAPAR